MEYCEKGNFQNYKGLIAILSFGFCPYPNAVETRSGIRANFVYLAKRIGGSPFPHGIDDRILIFRTICSCVSVMK